MRSAFDISLKLLAPWVAACALTAHAGPLQIKVQDEAGAPLADAVVMVPGTTPVPPTTPAIMDQINKAFVPWVLVVEQGRHVHFPNSDDIRHHVYSFSKPKPFEIKLYSGSQQAPILFDQPGIVALGCNIHDGMEGYIVVSDTVHVAKTDASGTATLNAPEGATQLRAWHPRLLKGNQTAIDMPVPTPDESGVITITLSLLGPRAPAATPGFQHRFGSHAR